MASTNNTAHRQLAGSKTFSRYSNASLVTTKATVTLATEREFNIDRILNIIVTGDPVILAYGDVTPTTSNMDGYFLGGFQGHIAVPFSETQVSVISSGSSIIHIIEN